jgi:hypothetical protein
VRDATPKAGGGTPHQAVSLVRCGKPASRTKQGRPFVKFSPERSSGCTATGPWINRAECSTVCGAKRATAPRPGPGINQLIPIRMTEPEYLALIERLSQINTLVDRDQRTALLQLTDAVMVLARSLRTQTVTQDKAANQTPPASRPE